MRTTDDSDSDWEDCLETDFEKVLATVILRTNEAIAKACGPESSGAESSGGGEESGEGGDVAAKGPVSGLSTHVLSAIMSGVATAFMQLTAKMLEKFREKEKSKRCECNENEVRKLEAKIDSLKYENDRLEQYSRRENIRVLNLSEPAGEKPEDLEARVAELCCQTGTEVTAIDFAACLPPRRKEED